MFINKSTRPLFASSLLKSQKRFVLVKYRDGLLMRVPEDSNLNSDTNDTNDKKESKYSLMGLMKMYQLYTQQKKSLEILNNHSSNSTASMDLTLNLLAKHGLLKYAQLREEMLRGNCEFVENNCGNGKGLIDKFIKDYRHGYYNTDADFKVKELYDLKLKKFEYQFQDGVGIGQMQIEFISKCEITLLLKDLKKEKVLCHRVNLFLNPSYTSSSSSLSTTTTTTKNFDEEGNQVLDWKVSSIQPFNDEVSQWKMSYYKIRYNIKESMDRIRRFVVELRRGWSSKKK